MSKNDLAFVLHALIKNEVELNDDTLEKLRKLLFEIDDSLILKSKHFPARFTCAAQNFAISSNRSLASFRTHRGFL